MFQPLGIQIESEIHWNTNSPSWLWAHEWRPLENSCINLPGSICWGRYISRGCAQKRRHYWLNALPVSSWSRVIKPSLELSSCWGEFCSSRTKQSHKKKLWHPVTHLWLTAFKHMGDTWLKVTGCSALSDAYLKCYHQIFSHLLNI